MQSVDGSPAVVLAEAASIALRTGTRMVEPAVVEAACAARGMDHDAWFASLLALRADDLIALQVAEPSAVVLLAITNAGLQRHLQATRPDIADVERRLAAAVAAAAGQGPQPLAEITGEPALLVEWLLDSWVNRRLLVYSKAPGRRFRVHKVLAALPGAAPAPTEAAAGEPPAAEAAGAGGG